MRRAEGTVQIFTFKDGLLARAAHDLELHFDAFDIVLDGESLRAEFSLKSLVVDGPVDGGMLRANRYDASKRADVAKAMHNDVLHTDKNPVARFTGKASARADGFDVEGRLDLAGRTDALAFPVRRDDAGYRASFEIVPSRWGIGPYKALLGAIRLKDVVRVVLALRERE